MGEKETHTTYYPVLYDLMMAALVQSLPSPSSTMTMLQTRSPSTEAFQNTPSSQQQQRNHQMPMNIYNTSVGGMAAGSYRGNTASSPGSSFSFQGSSVSQNGSNPLRQHPTGTSHPRYDNRTASTPTLPTLQQLSSNSSNKSRPTSSAPLATLQHSTSNDGSSPSRSLGTLDLNLPPTQNTSYAHVASRAAPDRYKRNHRRAETAGALTSNPPISGNTAVPSGSGMATVGHLYNHPMQSTSSPALNNYPSYRGVSSPGNANPQPPSLGHRRLSSQDDMVVQQRQPSMDLAKRYRRRSISSLEVKELTAPVPEQLSQPQKPKTYAAMLASPAPSPQKEARALPRDRPTVDSRRDSSESGSVASSAKSFSVCSSRFMWRKFEFLVDKVDPVSGKESARHYRHSSPTGNSNRQERS